MGEKAKMSLEEQTKLMGEKNALIATVKKLNRDISKLDNFKRNLLQTLQGGDGDTAELTTDYASDRLISNVLSSARATPNTASQTGPIPVTMIYDPQATTPNPTPAQVSAVTPGTATPTQPGTDSRLDGKTFFRQARAGLSYE